ncbi:nitric oxide synthase-interacting protein [Dermatophagoides pteronyssinus]|uniref:nitric oxide synthase-interacting protein n=1 Tax=Dermatophagoides pteronyssinus TaxID=6956 RepID=UPI003F679B66
MTRHAKNNTASSVYSYHERQRDNQSSGYGTKHKRLNKDSVKDFNACNLSLQPCRNPVITPDGYLYDKEAILEYIIRQKAKILRDIKRYEKEKQKDEQRIKESMEEDNVRKAEKFSNQETMKILGTDNIEQQQPCSSSQSSSVSNMNNGNDKQLPSFWIPNLTPSTEDRTKKPDTIVRCPISGKPLKANRLIDVKFTLTDPKCTDPYRATYKCAVSGDILTNSSRCVVLKTSGSVITEECLEKIIKKDMIDPINDKPIKESDIIPLQRGGTGYASANELEAKLHRPVMSA